jgi:hypothetical protein
VPSMGRAQGRDRDSNGQPSALTILRLRSDLSPKRKRTNAGGVARSRALVKKSPGLDTGAPPFKKEAVASCEKQHARRSSSALLPITTPPCKRPALPAWGIGQRPQDARYARSCTELQRRFSIPSSIPVSVSSDTPFEKGASRCSPGTSRRALRYIQSNGCTCNGRMATHSNRTLEPNQAHLPIWGYFWG